MQANAAAVAPAVSAAASSAAAQGALALLLIGATATGAAPIFVRLSEVGPVATGFYRLLFALPVLWLWLRLEGRSGAAAPERPVASGWHGPALLVLAGLFYAGDLALWHWSVRLTSVANATLLANLAPVFVVFAGWALFGERITLRLTLGLGIALAGAFLLVGGEGFTADPVRFAGDLCGVGTALFYAGYLLSVKRLRTRRYSAPTVMLWSGGATALALLLLALATGEALLPNTWQGWLPLVALALVSHVGGQSLIAQALAALPAGFASVGLLVQPVAATLLAFLVFGEILSAPQIAGAAVVLAGVLAVATSARR
jgi:drug/metabolite transporter (DMT)-like permease